MRRSDDDVIATDHGSCAVPAATTSRGKEQLAGGPPGVLLLIEDRLVGRIVVADVLAAKVDCDVLIIGTWVVSRALIFHGARRSRPSATGWALVRARVATGSETRGAKWRHTLLQGRRRAQILLLVVPRQGLSFLDPVESPIIGAPPDFQSLVERVACRSQPVLRKCRRLNEGEYASKQDRALNIQRGEHSGPLLFRSGSCAFSNFRRGRLDHPLSTVRGEPCLELGLS